MTLALPNLTLSIIRAQQKRERNAKDAKKEPQSQLKANRTYRHQAHCTTSRELQLIIHNSFPCPSVSIANRKSPHCEVWYLHADLLADGTRAGGEYRSGLHG